MLVLARLVRPNHGPALPLLALLQNVKRRRSVGPGPELLRDGQEWLRPGTKLRWEKESNFDLGWTGSDHQTPAPGIESQPAPRPRDGGIS